MDHEGQPGAVHQVCCSLDDQFSAWPLPLQVSVVVNLDSKLREEGIVESVIQRVVVACAVWYAAPRPNYHTFDTMPARVSLDSASAQDLPVLNVHRGKRSCMGCP